MSKTKDHAGRAKRTLGRVDYGTDIFNTTLLKTGRAIHEVLDGLSKNSFLSFMTGVLKALSILLFELPVGLVAGTKKFPDGTIGFIGKDREKTKAIEAVEQKKSARVENTETPAVTTPAPSIQNNNNQSHVETLEQKRTLERLAPPVASGKGK